MIIKSKPLPLYLLKLAAYFLSLVFKYRFNKVIVRPADVKPDHSYILMCNHFSFWDGLFAFYLAIYGIHKQQNVKALYVMSVKKQMEKKWWLRYIGSFSIEPGKRSVQQSLAYAAEVLSTPGNVLLYYPQGNLETSHIRHIVFKEGILEIVQRIKGNCQLIWSSNLTDYFESLKASLYFNMYDCGTNHDFDFDELKAKVNQYHLQAIQKNIRFTDEPEA
ncbi:hypothetical protein GCM10023149_06290 [Mucilaginibacter gynuensis]|uniref:Phospholipid/glycerol acyltransferase domain-containing protein n=1 Tax=Mucilaginibacter gynuensis TaxID=1302236 RepID=A0ABP8FUV5_9SPHI